MVQKKISAWDNPITCILLTPKAFIDESFQNQSSDPSPSLPHGARSTRRHSLTTQWKMIFTLTTLRHLPLDSQILSVASAKFLIGITVHSWL